HQVRLGDYGNAARDGKQAADFKMLAGLRLDGFVSGNHQQHQVNPADSGQHVAHKTLMARNVNEAEAQLLTTGSIQFEMGEAEINRDAAALLFLQPVSINAGKSAHQRGLAMIYVPGSADDDGLHCDPVYLIDEFLKWR